jgi:uroporphyrinogen decarboxylase
MTDTASRERVLTTLDHGEPDRVPIDFGGNQSSIHVKAYTRLLEYLGIQDDLIISDFVQQIARICDEMLDRFHVDTRFVRPLSSYIPYDRMNPEYDGKWVGVYDQFGVFWGNDATKDLADILYYDPVIHPLADAETVQDVENHPWPDGKDRAPFEGLRYVAKELHETGKAVSTSPTGNTFEYCTFLFGFVKTLKLTRTKPELLDAAMGHLLDYWKDYNTTFLGEVGEYLDLICINGDVAEQAGPIISPAFYEQHVKMLDKELVDHIKGMFPVSVNYHSCGSVPMFITHWIDVGYDAVNPVQISAYDMEPASLKARFGEKITFWGGLCNSQSTLPFGTPEAIRAEVEHNLSIMKPGGGYVAASVHNITAEVPPENIASMFDAAYEFGKY